MDEGGASFAREAVWECLTASLIPSNDADVVGFTVDTGATGVPRIIREYCEGDSIDVLSPSRLVASSLIVITNSGTALAARGTDARLEPCRAAELALC